MNSICALITFCVYHCSFPLAKTFTKHWCGLQFQPWWQRGSLWPFWCADSQLLKHDSCHTSSHLYSWTKAKVMSPPPPPSLPTAAFLPQRLLLEPWFALSFTFIYISSLAWVGKSLTVLSCLPSTITIVLEEGDKKR